MQKIQKRKVCRYYARGKCVKADCPFVHQQQTKKPCKFWIQTGFCRKGKNCQFYHATKQQEKKEKKYQQKGQGEHQEKIQRNYVGEKKQIQQKRKKNQQNSDDEGQSKIKRQTKIQQKKQPQQIVDNQTKLKINQQLLKQLQKNDTQKLQFFKQYPKNFPDQSKKPQIKQHIKGVEQKYFKNKPFLQILKELPTKQEQQYYQIIRRYQDSFKLEDQNEPRVYFINLRPLLFNKEIQLHFPFDEHYIQLKINQKLYPQSRAHFQILNQSMPQPYKHKFIDLLNKYHSKHNVFDTLKFFQNSFEKNYDSVKFKLQNEHYKKVELKQKIEVDKQKIKQQKEQKEQKQKHHNHKNHHHEHGKQAKQHEQQNEQHHNKIKNQQHQQKHHNEKKKQFTKQQKVYVNPPPIKPIAIKDAHILKQQLQKQKPKKQFRDYYQLDFNQHQKPQHQNLNDQITVDTLIMQNCPYMVLERILLYIQCNCSKVLMYLFDAQQKKQLKLWIKLKCKKCNDCVRIVWERAVIHNKGQLISRMSFVNGKLIDIGGLGWKIGCNCDEQIIKPKLFLPGQKMQVNCHTCFSNMNIIYNGLKHFNPFIKEFQLQQDKQLPLRGSCNHDKLNFRWIRYACCGRPFSCEQCHDLGAVKQHQIVNGLTMICGYCAHQQTIADQCVKCKKELIKGQDKAGHWQGGLGCRDQQLLSKKDAKKYAGIGKVESNNKKKKEK